MPTYEWEQIEAALTSAEERDGRLSDSGSAARSHAQATILQRHHEEVRASLVAEGGSGLEEQRRQYQEEGRRFNDAKKDAAIERSSDRLALLRSRVEASRRAQGILTDNQSPDAAPPLVRERILLATASNIRLKGDTLLDFRDAGSALEPWANRAKVADRWPARIDHLGFVAGVGLVFLWTNPYRWTVVVTVGSAVALNGFCYVGAGSTFFPSEVSVSVSTFLQPTVPFDTGVPAFQAGQSVNVGTVSADGGGFFGLGAVDSMNVGGYYGMYYQNFVVPRGQLAVFEVGSYFSAGGIGDCSAEVDFLSGDFLVLCPVVELTIVAP